ncbi:CIA30 family protein [Thalassoroseus pseudoceratinae]|uniref:CIA30 family protein n=1 Tax=Thalassoroseus pseudoceratinae TaxID=2713176 RepID=UPI00197FE2C5|nr:CIA30 family protein [Thalassoroseus pseudoceratinae]
MLFRTMLIVLSIGGATRAADHSEPRTLFNFNAADAAKQWQSVNDGVMGGRSDGSFKISNNQTMQFFGTLSLENNGGFASVRTRPTKLNLKQGDEFVLRVRGDGREYNLNLYPSTAQIAFSYRASFRTKKDKWIEVRIPLEKFAATSFGQVVKTAKFDPDEIDKIGILLGDKQAGPFRLEVDWIKVDNGRGEMLNARCEGMYPHHLQGVCTDEKSIYWSFTTTLVKTDMNGKLIKKIPVANHHGDLCHRDGKLYVAVNLGKFNDPNGNADSWIYVYDAESLQEVARHETQEVFHGAGGIGHRNGHYFVVGGLPDGVNENYAYEYDDSFKFVKKHTVKSGHTHLGIQTATFAHDRWWFGCYGDPRILLVTDANFEMKGRYKLDCSLGIEGLSNGRLLVARGQCKKATGCIGIVQSALPDQEAGFKLLDASDEPK